MKRVGIVLACGYLFAGISGALAQLPSSYDARAEGLITSVKNQSALGACWTFSGNSLLETGYIKAGLGSVDNTDFSEWQMANYSHAQSLNGYTYSAETPYTGGAGWGARLYDPIYYAQAQFSSTFTDEAVSPYPLDQIRAHESLSPPSQQSPTLGKAVVSSYGFDTTSGNHFSSTDLQLLKGGIINYGSVAMGIIWSHDSISTYEGKTIYNNTTESIDGGHAIVAVGWDDTVQVSDTQQGAFIMKNSWSEDWGDNGYFYLAYDSYIGDGACASWLEVEDASHLTSAYSTMPELDGADGNYPSLLSSDISSSAIAAKMDLDPARTDDDILVSLGLNTSAGEVRFSLYGSEADALGSGSGESLLYEGSYFFQSEGFEMFDLEAAIDVSENDQVWIVYESSSGKTWGYNFEEGALDEDYCYFLNDDVWEGSSTTNTLAPVSFYMIPEPGTLALLLCSGGILLAARKLQI